MTPQACSLYDRLKLDLINWRHDKLTLQYIEVADIKALAELAHNDFISVDGDDIEILK